MELSEQLPLCVDCDGTVTPTDLSHEAVCALLRSRPWQLLAIPLWLFRGRAPLKAMLASSVNINWKILPVNPAVIALVREARSQGRRTFLVTSADSSLGRGLANHLKLFDEVLSSDAQINLSVTKKTSLLRERFGVRGYDYVGHSTTDLPIWANARKAILVTNSNELVQRAKRVTEVDKVIPLSRSLISDYGRMLRVHQWLKNLLVFVPALAAHRIGEPKVFIASVLAFLSFGLGASAVYLLNDILDLESDRQHPRKQKRPLAAGRIPIVHGAALIPVLVMSALTIAVFLPIYFMAVLLGYFALTLAYSMLLKRQVIVDVMMLAGLYTIRVIGGAAAALIEPSFWLLAFSMFIFLSLALVKRYAELNVSLRQKTNRPAGRGYTVDDLPVLLALGVASGLISVLIVALYIDHPDLQTAYPSRMWLWFVPVLLLYWVSRLWMKTHRGEMHDDPVVFIVRDWQSLTVISLSALCLFLAARIHILVR